MQSLLTLSHTVHGLPSLNSIQLLLCSLTHVCVHLPSVSHEPGLVNQSWEGKRLRRYFPFLAELLAIHRFWERVIMVFSCISIAEPTKVLMHVSKPMVTPVAPGIVTGYQNKMNTHECERLGKRRLDGSGREMEEDKRWK